MALRYPSGISLSLKCCRSSVRDASNRFISWPALTALFPVLKGVLGLIRVLWFNHFIREQHRKRFPLVAKANHILFHFDARGAIEPFVKH